MNEMTVLLSEAQQKALQVEIHELFPFRIRAKRKILKEASNM
ncbi:hypothetical protein [Niallia taxi]|nr:hypothetical protein [Niallia taxi]MDK8641575.1 hypothetical protein [Niallia taxi]